jgi:hypothetical protein
MIIRSISRKSRSMKVIENNANISYTPRQRRPAAIVAGFLLIATVAIAQITLLSEHGFAATASSSMPKQNADDASGGRIIVNAPSSSAIKQDAGNAIKAKQPAVNAAKAFPQGNDWQSAFIVQSITAPKDGKRQVSISCTRLSPEMFKLAEGEQFQSKKIPDAKGRVVKINNNDVVLNIDGKNLKVKLGRDLKTGIRVQDETQADNSSAPEKNAGDATKAKQPAVNAAKSSPPGYDWQRLTVVKAIVMPKSGKTEVWIHTYVTDEMFKLPEGGQFQSKKIPNAKGQVVKINRDDVVLNIDGKNMKVLLGHDLGTGYPVKDETPAAKTEPPGKTAKDETKTEVTKPEITGEEKK